MSEPDTGDPDTGDPDTGDPDTGEPDTGEPDTGEPDTGFNRGAIRPFECIREGWLEIREDYWLFLGVTVVGLLIGTAVPLGVLLGPMMCGIQLCVLRRMHGQRVGFEMLFRGFEYFLPSLVIIAAQILPILLMLPFMYFAMFASLFAFAAQIGPGQPPAVSDLLGLFGVQMLLMLAFTFVITLLQALQFFAFPLIVDRKLGGFAALWTSIRAVLANPGGVLGFLFIWFVVGMFAPLFCYVGIFFILPIQYAAMTVAYRKVFPMTHRFDDYLDDEDEDDEPRRRERAIDNEPLEYLPSTAITSEAPPPRPSTDIQAEAPPVSPSTDIQAEAPPAPPESEPPT